MYLSGQAKKLKYGVYEMEKTISLKASNLDTVNAFAKVADTCERISKCKIDGSEYVGKLCKRYGATLYSYGNVVVMVAYDTCAACIQVNCEKLKLFDFSGLYVFAENDDRIIKEFTKQISNYYPIQAEKLVTLRFIP